MYRSAASALVAIVLAMLPGSLPAQSAAAARPLGVQHILPIAASVASTTTPPRADGLIVLADGEGGPETAEAGAAPAAAADPAPVAELASPAVLAPSVLRESYGLSGALLAAVLAPNEEVGAALLAATGLPDGAAPRWVPLHGSERRGMLGEPVFTGEVVAPETPGVWGMGLSDSGYTSARRTLSFITIAPFDLKRDGYLNGYHIGRYPTEGGTRDGVYAPPTGFIEVTAENQDLQVSEHFRLRQFLTKDQFDVWPKYLALNLRLIDKLELVLQELNAMGVRALSLHVMSGFRTPQYNGPGGDGRAALSRHMYGDAADIWVDGDSDGYIDDLNGDGMHDIRDAAVLLRAVERVEQKYPELTGGAGLYESNASHGPFVHVDVRGSRVRW